MSEKQKRKFTEYINNDKGKFAITKVYTKDISFESPNTPDIYSQEWNPSVNMQIANEASVISDEMKDLYEVVLRITVTVTVGEKAAYLVEVQQAGIFHIAGFPKEAIAQMLATICPNILFPFAREVVADLVIRGGFPQLLLSPVNFDALYVQEKMKAQQQKKEDTADEQNSSTKQ